MHAFERPEQERQKRISREKEASLPFWLVRFSFVLGVVGVIGFFLAFFYQTVLNRIGLPYRQAQAMAIAVVFVAWVIFTLACRRLGISTRGLTYPKLMSILRNEVETLPDEFKASRKQIAAAFGSLSDDWLLFRISLLMIPRKFYRWYYSAPAGYLPFVSIIKIRVQKTFSTRLCRC